MQKDEVQIGMRVRRINFDATNAPLGIIGVVTAQSYLNEYRFKVVPEDTIYPAWDWNCANMEFVSAGPVPSDPPSTARKDDSGKLDMTLLDDMPRAVAAIVEVMQWAITKKAPIPYERSSWLGVSADRYRAAIMRHNKDACVQASPEVGAARFACDKETGLLHLAHMACSSMMALENALRELEKSNAK